MPIGGDIAEVGMTMRGNNDSRTGDHGVLVVMAVVPIVVYMLAFVVLGWFK
jgi:hypothetical protein